MTLIVLLLTVFSSGVASAAGEWTVNPANYRYDMSLYLEVAFAGNEETFDHTRFDVASFVGDECGVWLKLLPVLTDVFICVSAAILNPASLCLLS